MKKQYIIVIAATLMFPVLTASAQFRLTRELMSSLFPAGVESPQINDDGSVTFRYQGADAQKVELNSQMLSSNRPMTKEENGVWSITVRPDNPDFYPYCFIVDGIQVADPNNAVIFPNEGFKFSLVDVSGPEPSIQDVQNVPHGKVTYKYYHSVGLGFDRPLCVYTPPGYDPAKKEKYPVLYLIHGMTDTYETWFKVGRVNVILDNLIAQGLSEKMIVVMPYANPFPEMKKQNIDGVYDFMNTDIVMNEITNEIIPFIESNYKVSSKAKSRAVAGFSLGGRQALATGLKNPDKFQWVCAFAPAIFGNEYQTNFENGTYAPLKKIKSSLKLFWISCGTDDSLISTSKELDQWLTDNMVDHTAHFSDGGHTWMNRRDYLELVAKQLFK